MRTTDELRARLQSSGGVLARTEIPELADTADWLVRKGELLRPLPGIFMSTECATDFHARCRAANLWQPDGVIGGPAAARLGFWPEVGVAAIDLHLRRWARPVDGIVLHRAAIPPEEVVEAAGLRFTSPTWTAVQLAATDDGAAIDQALRVGVTSVAELDRVLPALQRHRRDPRREFVVANSRDNPWSAAERQLHMVLRRGGIDGWTGNREVRLGGWRATCDIVFDAVKLVAEFQSWGFHGNQESFHRDIARAATLVAHGWTYLPVDWRMLHDEPRLLDTFRGAIAHAERR